MHDVISLDIPLFVGRVSLSAWAAITNFHGLGDLNKKQLVLIVLEAGKSKIRSWQIQWLEKALFLVCRWPFSCRIPIWWGVEREKYVFSFYEGISCHEGPISQYHYIG